MEQSISPNLIPGKQSRTILASGGPACDYLSLARHLISAAGEGSVLAENWLPMPLLLCAL